MASTQPRPPLVKFAAILFFLHVTNITGIQGKSLRIADPFRNAADGQGLYSFRDDVEVLTSTNFRERVYGQSNAWIIEFYNSWCGFCQRFAPSWKALATDIKPWKTMVSVGAIDCADDANSGLCREYEIMGYPSLRYFHENYQTGIGLDVKKGNDVDELKYELLKVMMAEQRMGRGIMYPNLAPYQNGNIKELFSEVGHRSQYAFLIVDKAGNLFGPHLALDFAAIPEIGVRFADFNNSDLIHTLGIKTLPYMLVVSRNGKVEVFSDVETLSDLRDAIVHYVKPTITVKFPTEKVFRGKWLEVEVPDMATLMKQKEKAAIRQKIKDLGDAIYQVDLETALRRSLANEVSAQKEISGEKLGALRAYVNVLRKYFPFGRQGKRFLNELFNLVNSRPIVLGKDVANLLRLNEDDSKMVFSSEHSWMACEGSTSAKRGYPCGLWKLFHYLTVAAANSEAENPKEVLYAMHGYIKNFFGCDDCSKHFQRMAIDRDIDGVTTLNGAVLWLWSAHNVVNARLAGDDTEDPEYPKVAFPTAASCARCRDARGAWSQPDVLRYLKTMYSRHNIKYLGSDPRVLQQQQQEPLANGDAYPHGGRTSVYEQIDSSMCFILYVFSFVLIIVLIRMFLKRGYRKKQYAHDLLGKV